MFILCIYTHRRRKLLNMGKGGGKDKVQNIRGGGGGVHGGPNFSLAVN